MYTGDADWSLIGELKSSGKMEIPIIGNGDITTPEGAAKAFDDYGVDGVMIGRGAIGATWIFHDVEQYLRTGEWIPLTDAEKFALLRRQISESIAGILRQPHCSRVCPISGRPEYGCSVLRRLTNLNRYSVK